MSSHAQHSHHEGGTPVHFTFNLIALFILTAITVAASYINFGSSAANVVIAMAIATVKATLVALIFMQLKWDKPVNSIIAVAGFLFLGILLMFTFFDTGSRRDPLPRNVTPMDAKQNPTPVPPSMNPLTTPAPQPPAPAAAKGEEGGIAVEH